jgi:hypothetical protein
MQIDLSMELTKLLMEKLHKRRVRIEIPTPAKANVLQECL